MNNKKGFTLIEITISVALLSLVMVFLLNFLSIIKKDEKYVSEQTKMQLNKSLVSKNINGDILNSGGIASLICDQSYCDITLNDGIVKKLEISSDKTKVTYTNITDNIIIFNRKLEKGYTYNLVNLSSNKVFLIKLEVLGYPEYDIEIVDYKASEENI